MSATRDILLRYKIGNSSLLRGVKGVTSTSDIPSAPHWLVCRKNNKTVMFPLFATSPSLSYLSSSQIRCFIGGAVHTLYTVVPEIAVTVKASRSGGAVPKWYVTLQSISVDLALNKSLTVTVTRGTGSTSDTLPAGTTSISPSKKFSYSSTASTISVSVDIDGYISDGYSHTFSSGDTYTYLFYA